MMSNALALPPATDGSPKVERLDKSFTAYKNLRGRRFTRLTVVREADTKNHVTYWLCKCVCGNTTIVKTGNLTTGNTKSCGCMRMEMLRRGLNTHAHDR